MKKFLALVLVLALSLGSVSAFADYEERVFFTASQMSQITEGGDYTSDAVYKKLDEMFNFEWELYAVDPNSWHEKNTMWINAGTMPDVLFFDWNATEYLNYAENELIKPLPDGWEEKYPNLAAQVEATGIADAIKVDGKTYCVPHIIFYLVAPEDFVYTYHNLYYYRLDWAKELGYNWEATCTLQEWENYLRDCKEKYGSIGMTQYAGQLLRPLMYQFNKGYDTIYKNDEGEYVLGFAQEGTVEGIEYLRKLYQEGLISTEYYLNNGNEFYLGNSACYDYWGGPGHPQLVAQTFLDSTNDESLKTLEDMKSIVGTVTVTDNEGVYHSAGTSANFCFASLFSPDLDDVTFDRILAIYDYLATLEGFELAHLGIEGVDFQRNEDGTYTQLCPEILDGTYNNIRQKYPSMYYLMLRNVLADSSEFVNPTSDPFWVNHSNRMFAFRAASDIIPYDTDYAFYNSEAKARYSNVWRAAVDQIVLDPTLDVKTEVERIIEENRPIWEPLLEELNETF